MGGLRVVVGKMMLQVLRDLLVDDRLLDDSFDERACAGSPDDKLIRAEPPEGAFEKLEQNIPGDNAAQQGTAQRNPVVSLLEPRQDHLLIIG